MDHNCYDFAISFLKLMELSKKHPSINDRSSFCQTMIHPETSQATKYITIYRQVLAQKVIVQSSEASSTSL